MRPRKRCEKTPTVRDRLPENRTPTRPRLSGPEQGIPGIRTASMPASATGVRLIPRPLGFRGSALLRPTPFGDTGLHSLEAALPEERTCPILGMAFCCRETARICAMTTDYRPSPNADSGRQQRQVRTVTKFQDRCFNLSRQPGRSWVVGRVVETPNTV